MYGYALLSSANPMRKGARFSPLGTFESLVLSAIFRSLSHDATDRQSHSRADALAEVRGKAVHRFRGRVRLVGASDSNQRPCRSGVSGFFSRQSRLSRNRRHADAYNGQFGCPSFSSTRRIAGFAHDRLEGPLTLADPPPPTRWPANMCEQLLSEINRARRRCRRHSSLPDRTARPISEHRDNIAEKLQTYPRGAAAQTSSQKGPRIATCWPKCACGLPSSICAGQK